MQPVKLMGRSAARFIDYRGRERSSMFFRNGDALLFVKTGARFKRSRNDNMVETARVLSVSSDSFGIPHVRYEIAFQQARGGASFVDGPRVLSLDSFVSTYRKRLAG